MATSTLMQLLNCARSAPGLPYSATARRGEDVGCPFISPPRGPLKPFSPRRPLTALQASVAARAVTDVQGAVAFVVGKKMSLAS